MSYDSFSYETGTGLTVDPSTLPFDYERGTGTVAGRRATSRATAPTATAPTDPAAIVTVLVANPKKIGSATYGRFALYVDGATVATSLKNGVLSGDIRWDLARDFIRIDPVN